MSEESASIDKSRYGLILITATLLMAISGLIYELLAGTLSSYLLGDSVTQFSLVIGCFLTSMGVGSWLSRFISKNQLSWLIAIEVAVGFIGGTMTVVGFAAFTYTSIYQVTLLSLTSLIGILVGLEIPLVICILKDFNSVKVTIANVMSADYIGALVASLIFPFILVPHLGLNKSGILAGAANVFIAFLLTLKFKPLLKRTYKKLVSACVLCLVFLAGLYFTSTKMISHMEDSVYQDEIIFAKNSKFQRIVITRWRDDLRLYLNGHLQFSSIDEYRYHEVLVHMPMSAAKKRESVLILGGGDGLAISQVLKYPEVEKVTLVDLDNEVTDIFKNNPMLRQLNNDAFHDSRVEVVNTDALHFLNNTKHRYDVIIADLPDPSDAGLAKLYSKSFYGLAARHLNPGGKLMTQSTSPFRAREAFWCIHNTLKSIEIDQRPLRVKALHVMIPTFGKWGFNLASFEPFSEKDIKVEVPCEFLSQDFVESMFKFPIDMGPIETGVSTLNEPKVVTYYRQGYHKYLD
ncbi:MAG: polyamine aminopropyltransferase [Lentisphaeraceae bacterium]|nr:polyamine aminopropyltransferase [Lentisphaeraceae bacterium]